jgi:ribosomal protein S18 acetylase RimI-like enzyme
VEHKKVVGCLTWHGDETNWTINLGYISPEYRRKGLYSKLHAALVEKARAARIPQITSIVKPTNDPIRASKLKEGYTLHSLYYVKNLNAAN